MTPQKALINRDLLKILYYLELLEEVAPGVDINQVEDKK